MRTRAERPTVAELLADLSQMARLQGAATTPMADSIDPQVRLQGSSPKGSGLI